jgi:predicted MFS family arabinose efflux permease
MTETKPTAPSSVLSGGAAFAAAAFAFFAVMPGTTLPTPLYPLYRQAFGLSELTITVVFAVYALGVLVVLVVAGGWSDQIGRKPMLLAGVGFAVLGTAILACSQGLTSLLIGRVVVGFSAGVFTGTGTVTVLELAPERWRKRAPLIATAANMMGLGSGPLLAGVLADYAPLPLRLPYLVELGLLVLALACVGAIPETRPRRAQGGLQVHRLQIVPEVRPVFVPAALACFAGFAVLGVFGAAAPALLHDVFGFSRRLVFGGIMFLLFLCSTAGQVLQSRIPRRVRLPSGCAVLAIGAGLIGFSIHFDSLVLLLLGAVINGIGHGIVFRGGIEELAAASPTTCRGETISAFFVVAYVAISLPVIGFGASIAPLHLSRAGELFSGIVAGLALIAWLLLPRAPHGGVDDRRHSL